ncbi:MAG: hypothetical protein N3A69_17495, partial [Leptospiraceae bacterium]|nr:hypothetical protein [Leptospiraceae bacterium]
MCIRDRVESIRITELMVGPVRRVETEVPVYQNYYNFYRSIKVGDEEKISDVFGKLDQIMVRYGLKEKIYNQRDYVNVVEKNYNRTTIEFNFKSVALQDIFKMIYDIEFNKQVSGKVTYLNFRKVPITGKELYDVNLRVSSYSRITNPKK